MKFLKEEIKLFSNLVRKSNLEQDITSSFHFHILVDCL